MRYTRVAIDSFGYELAPNVITSAALDDRIAPVYKALRIPPGQIAALSGIRERRFWNPGQGMADGALRAARKALATAAVQVEDIGLLIYGGVCRDNLEPATACAVADGLGLSGHTQVYDVSNACLGVVNGMVQIANAIELGQIRAGMVVSCESARQIVDTMIERLLAQPDMERFKITLATLTGGSGAVAVVLADTSLTRPGRRLMLGGVTRSAARHHRLCRWGPDTGIPSSAPTVMETHAIEVLENGVQLGIETWRDFVVELCWPDGVDKTICHQVGTANRDAILKSLGIPAERDFSTYPYLGNIGTVSLPITAAIAEEREFLQPGDRVGFLGIGSGLNCVMLGVEW
ncbi:MAG: 3-oxoacyl-ACP synthase III [Planctomycetota bacterium]